MAVFSNRATGKGGGIFATSNVDVNIFDSSLYGNAAGSDGGAILFDVGDRLTITGSQIIENHSGGNGGALHIDNNTVQATIRATVFNGNSADGNGGAMENHGRVEISQSQFIGNRAGLGGAGAGGAIFDSFASAVDVLDSEFTGNSAGSGGAIRIDKSNSPFTITNSVIHGNTAKRGGGIDNDNAILMLLSSTVSANTATDFGSAQNGEGGGIWNSNSDLTVINSTISGNHADVAGGGLRDAFPFNDVTISSSTIVNNTASIGGGVAVRSDAPLVKVENSIIALNDAATNPDVVGDYNSLSHNIVGDVGAATGFGATGDQIGSAGNEVDPLLGPLQNNGGRTETHPLLAGSPALDAGDNLSAPATDQRGVSRPQNGTVDIGAFEAATSLTSGFLSATGSRDYLVSVMDQYHTSYNVYEDVSSGGNHFHAWAELRKSIVVDNLAIGFTQTGIWTESDATDEFVGSSLESGDPSATARFTPSIPEDGDYEVWVWWSAVAATNVRDSTVNYTIQGSGAPVVVTVDQTTNSGNWQLLDTVNFAAGASGFVELSHGTPDGGFLSGDAVRFVSTATNTKVTGSSTDNPKFGATEIKAELIQRTATNSGGFYHQVGVLPKGETSPQENFGSVPDIGVNLSGVERLTFWARGESGGEQIEFFVGGVGYDPQTGQQIEQYPGSSQRIPAAGAPGALKTLTTDWQQFTIDLTGADLSYVLGGFGWFGEIVNNPGGAVFYLDDIKFEFEDGGAAQMDRLNEPRFLRSYTTLDAQPDLCDENSQPGCVDFDFVLRNVAFSYDNALAILAFLADGDPATKFDSLRRAKLIGNAFVQAAANDRTYVDGRIRTAYSAGDIALPPGWLPNGRLNTPPASGIFVEDEVGGVITRSFLEVEQSSVDVGNNAWVMIAMLELYQRTGDDTYLDAAERIGAFLQTFRNNQGTYQGFFGRIENAESANPIHLQFASTEHNLDVHAAFSTLFEITGDQQWLDGANHARQFVEAMWDDQRNVFLTGTADPVTRNTNPAQMPLDAQSWSVLSIPDVLRQFPEVLDNAIVNQGTTSDGYLGFDFNDDNDGVWFEGTAQMAVALESSARPADAETYRQELRRAQSDPALDPVVDSLFNSEGGIPAASHDQVSTGFSFELFRRDHIAVGAWNIFAQLNFNPFYGMPVGMPPEPVPAPTQIGQTFVVDDFDNKVTLNDVGFNYFGGNSGTLNNPEPARPAEEFTTLTVSNDSLGSVGGSLQLDIDFTVQAEPEATAGFFTSLFGLTDTKIALSPGQEEPLDSTPFDDYFLDFDNIFGDFLPLQNRSIELLALDMRLATGSPALTVKVELKDELGNDVFTRIDVDSTTWTPVTLSRSDFDQSVSGQPFNWNEVSIFSIVVERVNVADDITNPDVSSFLIDNLRLIDTNGEYVDLEQFADPNGSNLQPQFEDVFFDYVRSTSAQYFLDFASTDPRTGGIVQDRSTFADLMTVGGVGFQLTSYVIAAERGYLTRTEAAMRVQRILEVLNNDDMMHPMGPNPADTIGYKGFFYHFLGPNGLRKHNFDFTDTPTDERLNTVELSTIDTALAVAGAVTAQQYFDADDGDAGIESQIRRMANEVYARVDWNFMLTQARHPDDPQILLNQFYLGWKPNEVRDDDTGRFGRFLIDDADGLGQYSSKLVKGEEQPATLDFYTDEGLLIALLAM